MSSNEMDYNESLVYKEMLENSEKLAEEIMKNIRRLGLEINFALDDLTLADGNCFFRGILQQCRRPEVYSTLPDEVKVFVDNTDHHGFRYWIKHCVLGSTHVRVQQETLQPFLPKPWDYYWSDDYMMKNGFWADSTMVRCTAWFLKKDLMIISEDNNDLQCTTTISGNMEDPSVSVVGPQLYLGFARNHYQSILPLQVYGEGVVKKVLLDVDEEEAVPKEDEDIVPDVCPSCKKTFKQILKHLAKKEVCKEFIGKDLLNKWTLINANSAKKRMRENYINSGKRQEYRQEYIESGRNAQDQANYSEKKRNEDHDGWLDDQRKRQRKCRSSHDEEKRHRNFLEDTKYGPVFICLCCHRKLSRGNVTVYNEKIEKQIKLPLEECIFDMDVYTNVIEIRNGKEVYPNSR